MNNTIIAAVSSNYVIGKNGKLPWEGELSADLKRFKKLTIGHPVIMGRKTFESLKSPLLDRINIVITNQNIDLGSRVIICDSLNRAIEMTYMESSVFIIGGGEIYREAITIAHFIELTIVHSRFDGDTYFPRIDPNSWHLVSRERHEPDDKNKYPYSFLRFERKRDKT